MPRGDNDDRKGKDGVSLPQQKVNNVYSPFFFPRFRNSTSSKTTTRPETLSFCASISSQNVD